MSTKPYWEAIGAVVLAAFLAMIVVWTGASKDFGSCLFGIIILFALAAACRVDWFAFFKKLIGM